MKSGSQEAPTDFGTFRTALHGQFESLSPHLKRIAEYVIGEPVRFALQTAAEAARQVEVQPSTLVRFAQLFGFSGFSELQQLFRRRLLEGDPTFDAPLEPARRVQDGEAGAAEAEILDACAVAAIKAVRRLQTDLDVHALRQAVGLLKQAGSVRVYGHARTYPLAACLTYGLMERRYRCSLLDAVPGTSASDILCMDGNDVLVALAFAEMPQSLIDGFVASHARGVSIVAVTNSEFHALSRVAHVRLAAPEPDEQTGVPLAAHFVLVQSLVSALPIKGA